MEGTKRRAANSLGMFDLLKGVSIIRQMKKNGKRREYGKEIGGSVRRENGKQEGGFFKKGNMVDGNVVKGYT